jgi:hypothetical protein
MLPCGQRKVGEGKYVTQVIFDDVSIEKINLNMEAV